MALGVGADPTNARNPGLEWPGEFLLPEHSSFPGLSNSTEPLGLTARMGQGPGQGMCEQKGCSWKPACPSLAHLAPPLPYQPDSYLPREYWEKLEASTSPLLMKSDSDWFDALRVELGICLLELMVQVLKVRSNLLNCNQEQKLIPVLYHVYSFSSSYRVQRGMGLEWGGLQAGRP